MLALFLVRTLCLLALLLDIFKVFQATRSPRKRRPRVEKLSRNSGSSTKDKQRQKELKTCLKVIVVFQVIRSAEPWLSPLSYVVPFFEELKLLGYLWLTLSRSLIAASLYATLIERPLSPYIHVIDTFGSICFISIPRFVANASIAGLHTVLELAGRPGAHEKKQQEEQQEVQQQKKPSEAPESVQTRQLRTRTRPSVAPAYFPGTIPVTPAPTTVVRPSDLLSQTATPIPVFFGQSALPQPNPPPVYTQKHQEAESRHTLEVVSQISSLPAAPTLLPDQSEPANTINEVRTVAHLLVKRNIAEAFGSTRVVKEKTSAATNGVTRSRTRTKEKKETVATEQTAEPVRAKRRKVASREIGDVQQSVAASQGISVPHVINDGEVGLAKKKNGSIGLNTEGREKDKGEEAASGPSRISRAKRSPVKKPTLGVGATGKSRSSISQKAIGKTKLPRAVSTSAVKPSTRTVVKRSTKQATAARDSAEERN